MQANLWIAPVRAVARAVAAAIALTLAAPAGASCTDQWVYSAGLSGPDAEVHCFASHTLPGTAKPVLVVGGSFANVAGVACKGVAAWDGVHWAPMGAGLVGRVNSLAVVGGKLYAGGYFTNPNAPNSNHVAVWDGSAWQALIPANQQGLDTGPGGEVFALCGDAFDQLWVGGWFSTLGTASFHNIAIWNPAVKLWSTTSTGLNGEVDALALYQGHIVAGGAFSTAVGAPMLHIGYFVNNDGWHQVGAGIEGWVRALAVDGNTLYAGGQFATDGTHQTVITNVAQWRGQVWAPVTYGLNGTVRSLTMFEGSLFAAGEFTATSSAPRSKVAWFDTTVPAWMQLGTGLGGTGIGLGVFGNELYVGGDFLTAGGLTSNRVATWSKFVPWIASQPQNVNAAPDGTAVLSANVALGYSGSAYQWKRNGAGVVNGAGGASAGGGTVSGGAGAVPSSGQVVLTIQNAKASDAGGYTLVVTSGCGSATSNAAQLSVGGAGNGDMNGDGHINTVDLSLFLVKFGQSVPAYAPGDYNGDGQVNTADLTILLLRFGL